MENALEMILPICNGPLHLPSNIEKSESLPTVHLAFKHLSLSLSLSKLNNKFGKMMDQQSLPTDQSKPFHNGSDHHSPDYSPYPKLDPNDVVPPSQSHPPPAATATTMPAESNPYVSSSPSRPPSSKNTMDSVRDVLGKWGKKAADATKKAENLAGNMWQHLKTSPNVADAAVARIAQGTKVLAEGGYEKVFRQTFPTTPAERLQKSYACYLSTSVGPIMGTLYLSTTKLAFCSDNPLPCQVGEKTEWSHYKVVIQLTQVKSANPSTNKTNPAEKYIQIITVDDHEFWFMGFVNYDSAVKNLKGVQQMQSHC